MSRRLPALKPKQVLRILERAGFFVHHVKGSHYVLKHHVRIECRVTIPWHNRDLKRGTLASIIHEAGLSVEEFNELI